MANVKGKTGDIAGYMPLQKQVGFIYDNPNPHIVAHELGHGAFNLRHPFSPENFIAAQGTTKNLMDYTGTTDLWKHQWDLIHDPKTMLFAWAQDEKEAAMIASSDTGKFEISISEMNVEFAPGIGEMKLKYKLGDSTKVLLERYSEEDFLTKMFVFDKNGQKLYEAEKEATAAGEFAWNGYFGDKNKDSLVYENGPFNLSLALTNADSSITNWQDFNDWAYETFVGDSLNVFTTGCDTIFTILTGAHLEWVANKDIQGYVYPKTLDDYTRYREIYMSYAGVEKAGSPFDYIKENTKRVDFFGKQVLVHNEFAKVLESVKTSLTTKGVYTTLTSKYKNQMGTLVMRTMNDPNGSGKVSEHGFGMAIDFYVKKNPQILKSNAYVRFYIKKSTGFDLGESKTVSQIKNANDNFMTIYQNTTIDELVNKYKGIENYNNDTSNIKINSLESINNTIADIFATYKKAEEQITTSENALLIDRIDKYAKQIDNLAKFIPDYKNTILFSTEAKEQVDELNTFLTQIHSWLLSVNYSMKDTSIAIVNNLPLINISDFNTIQTEITSFDTDMKKLCSSLSVFATKLKSGIGSIGFGNVLLQDGFCGVELDLINAFLDADERIQWGGTFNSKIDAMHFGFTSEAATEIVNKK
ncbi:hypothetical protein [Williamwhitmania taraxaci]|uniref:Uncharacterized protein n=1 Tax=Williamwhitmania taraxaci TaxID=1640674 RepID=A0A1G6THB4_9BACT|nr:hypothetical protein [Williamwhitmania taraxaci]SDD28409.1 hypothetical protein SAMN05216323_11233 [Williamwhitmania taraxaci]